MGPGTQGPSKTTVKWEKNWIEKWDNGLKLWKKSRFSFLFAAQRADSLSLSFSHFPGTLCVHFISCGVSNSRNILWECHCLLVPRVGALSGPALHSSHFLQRAEGRSLNWAMTGCNPLAAVCWQVEKPDSFLTKPYEVSKWRQQSRGQCKNYSDIQSQIWFVVRKPEGHQFQMKLDPG